MRRTFVDDLYSSWALWFDHELLEKGEAFYNQSGILLKNNKDKNLNGYYVFGSQYKQWVYDSSIPNVQIPSGVYVNNSFTPRGTSGLKIDYLNGRAIFTSGNNSWNVSGNFSAKEFNIYPTTKSDQELIFETNYVVNPSVDYMATGDLSNKVVAPCIFLKINDMSNEEFAFGGLNNSTVKARAIILADSESSLNGVGNIFADLQKSNFCILNSAMPITRFGDTKSGSYNYNTLVQQNFSYDKLVYLDEIYFSRLRWLDQNSITNKIPDLYVGFIDFSLDTHRFTRI